MSTYWQDRMAASQDAISNKSIKEVEKQLKKYYLRATKSVIADFEATFDKLLATMEDGKEPTVADLYKLQKYWEMEGQLKKELQKLGDKEIKLLSDAFETNFFEVYYSIVLPHSDNKAFNTISTEAVQQMINQIWVADGKSWSQRIWDNTNRLAETLNAGLIECVTTGKKTSELKRVLQERFNVSYSNADALVRTEMAHIQTQAAKTRYENNGIKKVQFWADPDERTCPECGALHKKIYLVGEHVPCPAHPRCRCCIVPVIE